MAAWSRALCGCSYISQRTLNEAAEAARVGFWARDRPLTGSQFDTLSVRSWPELGHFR
jgi:hypothetical protein